MRVVICISILAWHLTITLCQRYAERNNLPVDTLPVEETYDEYYSEGYDFDAPENDIYRWNVEDYPNPQDNFRYCNRMKASYICDPDMVLESEQADKLDSYIREMYKDTPCICGDQCNGAEGGIVMGIALLKNMFQPYNEHPSQIIRTFAERLRKKWNLGKCDNDILIVVATTDRLSYTDVGKATAYHVSLKEAYRIFLEHKAQFTAGHFYEGLHLMQGDYYKKTKDIKLPVADKLNVGLIAGSIVGGVAVLALILFITFFICRRRMELKDLEKQIHRPEEKPEGVPSGWTKKDIKVMFSSLKSNDKPQSLTSQYQPCDTEEKDDTPSTFRIEEEEEEVIDTTLAQPYNPEETKLTSVSDTSASEMLNQDLTEAIEELGLSFPPSKSTFQRHETNF